MTLGLTQNEYLDSTDYELEAMAKVYQRLEEKRDRRWASFMALFANANSGRGKTFGAEDFLPAKPKETQSMTEEEIFAAFDAIFPQSDNLEK